MPIVPYAIGFRWGERRAFMERKQGMEPMKKPDVVATEKERGFWDGYLPRRDDWRRNAGVEAAR